MSGNKKLRLFLRAVIGGVLFLVVLTCITFSKLTLITLTNELRHLTVDNTEAVSSRTMTMLASVLRTVLFKLLLGVRSIIIDKHLTMRVNVDFLQLAASRVYWQLLFILVLPHCLTFVRSAFIGVIGKKRSYYPWPRKSALIAVRTYMHAATVKEGEISVI